MSEAILIFTFSPVQQFISEARRTADLFTGSRILVELARAAGEAIKTIDQSALIYPRDLEADVPNKLVARVPWGQAEEIADKAREMLLAKWGSIADEAKQELKSKHPEPDSTWEEIWERQISNVWEFYWAAALMKDGSYKEAYAEASRVLDGVKRTRCFQAAEEDGLKDTLSGRRSALRTASYDAKAYWKLLSQKESPSKIRPEGRERLDAIGAVKRFCSIAKKPFPSTSTVASYEFLELARAELSEYCSAVKELLNDHLYKVREEDSEWPYDGDLLYIESLTQKRLEASYGAAEIDESMLSTARAKLSKIYARLESRPSPYYAVIVLDGDSMGERIADLLGEPDPLDAHSEFSKRLGEFANSVPRIIGNTDWLVYNGGDDVLMVCPLSKAVPLAQELAQEFRNTTGGTASAGIAIAHHLYPLDATLTTARRAENVAKSIPGKNAVCIHVLRRGGEEVQLVSKWDNLANWFGKLVAHFKNGDISSRLAYNVLREASAITGLGDKQLRSAYLRHLVSRHKSITLSPADEDNLVSEMLSWSIALDDARPSEDSELQGLAELGRWLVFARFVAQGGVE